MGYPDALVGTHIFEGEVGIMGVVWSRRVGGYAALQVSSSLEACHH